MIPLLFEIPFRKKIAELYSRGSLVAEYDPVFAGQLSDMAGEIINNHGNSSN